MNRGFWDKLKKPIFALAPMANVTDAAFRRVIAKYGKPDVLWTEFVSADGLCSPGREVLSLDLRYGEAERPIVAQLFGAHPEKMEAAAALVARLGFDGLDINMGCPDKAVERQGAGAAMMKNPKLAQEIIAAAKRGVAAAGSLVPVSVKTRIGYKKNELAEWLPALFETGLAAITIHARTRAEMSKVPARWSHVREAVEMANGLPADQRPLILGNGDVETLAQAEERIQETGADGVMIGRGIFGNPWLFASRAGEHFALACPFDAVQSPVLPKPPEVAQKLSVMLEHTRAFEELYGPAAWEQAFGGAVPSSRKATKGKRWVKSFDVMKKHYKAYVNGFPGASVLRAKLMAAKDAGEVAQILKKEYPEAIDSSV